MVGVRRAGRAVNGRPASLVKGELERVCPKCGAARGWRCVRVSRGTGATTTLKHSHAERRQVS